MYQTLIKCFIFLLVFPLHITYSSACETIVKIQQTNSEKDRLIKSLLALSLSKSSPNTCIAQSEDEMSIIRLQLQVENSLLDVMWTSADLKDVLTPVRIPIFKGFLGYRIFVIRQNDQVSFDHITSLSDLKTLYAGIGKYWGDKLILSAAGIPLITTQTGNRLWNMLANKRFDYFPLAIHEPWEELEVRTKLALTTENNLLISYPSALYFHVHKSNLALLNLISSGMKKALEDGSYDKLLLKSKMIQNTVKFANISKRKLIKIENREVNRNTPKENLNYWLTHEKLIAFLEQAKTYH